MARLTSSPQIDNRVIYFRLMSGESLLKYREVGRRRKEMTLQEDTDGKGITF